MVCVRKGGQLPSLVQPYIASYKVVKRGPKFFCLEIGGRDTGRSVDWLKPHTGTAAATPAAPPW